MKKIILIGLTCLTVAACATLSRSNMDWIAIGPEFPAKKASEIEIFTDSREIKRPYGNIGLLRVKNLSPDRDTLKRGVYQARKYVADKGADAMFLGQYNSAEEGSSDPKVTLIIYALKYGDNLTEEDFQAMNDFAVDGALNAASLNY